MVDIDAKGKDFKAVSQAVKDAVAKGAPVVIKNAVGLYGLGAGQKSSKIKIVGDTGDYIGIVNAGGEIVVEGSVHNFVGDNMNSGKIVVTGSAGYGAGMYPYGGILYIKGDAGDFTATMNKGATIVIGGNVGDEVGTYMTAGKLIVLGNAGKDFGNYFIRGTIYLGGTAKRLGHNVKLVELCKDDIVELKKILDDAGFKFDVTKLKKYVPETEKPFYEHKKPAKEAVTCR